MNPRLCTIFCEEIQRNRIVVAGIGTEVGKTVVSAILTEALDGHYWKPVQCGFPTDQEWVDRHISMKQRTCLSRFSFSTPSSPHLAARKEGIRIEAETLSPPLLSTPLIIEGTGGLLAPLNEVETWADAAAFWEASWVLVHRHYLGSLNHFFLTIEAMKQRKIPLLGVIFNGEGDPLTEEMLLQKAESPCLGRLAWQEPLTPSVIQKTAKKWKETLGQSETNFAFGTPSRKQRQLLAQSQSLEAKECTSMPSQGKLISTPFRPGG